MLERLLPTLLPTRHRGTWALLVPVVFAVVGLLATTSAQTARGTDLRSSGRSSTADVIREQQHRADQQEARVAALRQQVDALTTQSNPSSKHLRELNARVGVLAAASGTTAVRGPALTVKLDDAPHQGSVPSGFTADDMVVHQQDVQAVVNALWAGGAEAMMLMDQRVISTSAVRCVGNVLILQGRVYSPPYVIRAIGPQDRMRAALNRSSALRIYRQYVDVLGLGYDVSSQGSLAMPGYDGALDLRYATPVTS
ncbi:MAG TPA: DUF881 domain-containing protein [Actinomycetales bacterium]|nr:DUF881 domain-containing protein [Actinomycetales bacterium]